VGFFSTTPDWIGPSYFFTGTLIALYQMKGLIEMGIFGDEIF
jgi:hypothetical protein